MEINIEKIIKKKELEGQIVVAIDGKCGSGKTTLSDKLNANHNYNVVHMDDFYLPFQKRDKNWMNEIGGHMDFDRVIDTVLKPYKEHIETNYISYDCHSDKYLQKIDVDLDKILLLEGSYSCHTRLKNYIDVKIFVDIDDKLQYERLMKRNEKLVDKFVSMWIPFENRYFEEMNIKQGADFIIKN